MSGLGLATKKVNVYGRKKTQILSVHVDLSPVKASAYPSTDRAVPQSPIAARRPPLLTKSSLNIVTTSEDLLAQEVKSKKGGKQSSGRTGKAAAGKGVDAPKGRAAKSAATQTRSVKKDSWDDNTESEEEEEVIVVHQRRGARPADRRSSTKPSTPVRARSQKLLSVEIPVSRPRPPRAATPARETSVPPVQVTSLGSDAEAVEAQLASLRLDATASADPLEALLAVCDSHEIEAFDALRRVLAPRMDQDHTDRTTIVKVGEASYSEVFGVLGGSPSDQGTVVKVVPLSPGHFNRSDKLPDCSDPIDVLREIEITRKLSGTASGGFVDYKQAYVVRGAYPEYLLHAWDEYKLDNGTYSKRPDCFAAEQTYVVIVLANHGADLEAFQFDAERGWIQAVGVLLQTARTLAAAEKDNRFEHRDLHEGQVLISLQPSTSAASSAAGDYAPSASGVRATIIDFGLSRLALDQDRIMYSSLPPELFESKGEQWDVYRSMRDVIGDDWAGFHPITNVMWLHYLARYIVHRSSLKAPKARRPNPRSATATVSERNTAAHVAMLQIVDMLLGSVAAAKAGSEDRPRRGGRTVCGSAEEVVQWAETMGWTA